MNHNPSTTSLIGLVLVSLMLAMNTSAQNRWEPFIQAFEEQDQEDPPPENAIVFAGSSSIVYWRTLKDDMAPLTVINRGFGGSQMFELNMYRDRIVTNYKPKAIVVYEGDNDVAAGKSVNEIVSQSRDFISHVDKELSSTEIYLIAVKPSIARAAMWETMKEVNDQLKKLAEENAKVHYLDIASPMLQESGLVKEDLFVDDGLHLNAKGYEIWTNVVRPVLLEKYGS